MALVKCPDCEKMVSERVANCPFCGCPAEFFIKENSGSKEKCEDSNNKIVFTLGKEKITYSQSYSKHAAFYGECLKMSEDVYCSLIKNYNWAGDIESVLKEIPKRANPILYKITNEAVKRLYNNGIVLTAEAFVKKYENKYVLNIEEYLNIVKCKLGEIQQEKQDLKHKRNMEKSSRGRWQGGGFGISGAIKGAITAGVMNAGADLVHSFGDSAKENRDEKRIAKQMERLYSSGETKELLCGGVKQCIMNIYYAYCDEVNCVSTENDFIEVDSEKAFSIYEATMSYEKERDKVFANIVKCISVYPGEKKFYDIFGEMKEIDKKELERFIAFWNIDFMFKQENPVDSNNGIYLRTEAVYDRKSGMLTLKKGELSFTGKDVETLIIPIDKIKKVEASEGSSLSAPWFTVGVKGRFLLYPFTTPETPTWVEAIENARKGIYEYISVESKTKTKAMKEDENASFIEYLYEHINDMSHVEAVAYYRKNANVTLKEAQEKVREIEYKMGKI